MAVEAGHRGGGQGGGGSHREERRPGPPGTCRVSPQATCCHGLGRWVVRCPLLLLLHNIKAG